MKVLDLHCEHGHSFEAWFASEQAFQEQNQSGLLQCPMCGSASVTKKPSAPRLNLSGAREAPHEAASSPAQAAARSQSQPQYQALDALDTLASAWLEMSRRVVASTQDVGDRFAEEARKMHYGEVEERAIRGKTSLDEARALQEEGIDVLPIALPAHLNKLLH